MESIFNAVWKELGRKQVDFEDVEYAVDEIYKAYSPRYLTTQKASSIDYEQEDFQCAYIYTYMTSHTNIIADLLGFFWKHKIVRQCIENCRRSLRVCSIGGGPGTDVFGIDVFLKRYVGRVNVHGTILDHVTSWDVMFEALLNDLDARNLNNVNYKWFDFFSDEEVDDDTIDAVSTADIVTIVKFVSVVAYKRRFTECKLMKILQEVKQGALVLFVDNSGGGYLDMMNRAAYDANLTIIEEMKEQDCDIPIDERLLMERTVTTDHISTLPQHSAVVSAAIWHKF